MPTEIFRHREGIYQDAQVKDPMECIMDNLERVSQMSMPLFNDILDMNIQQLMIGKHFEKKQIQIQTQILHDKGRNDMNDKLDLGRGRKKEE
ncbi:MAG: hypothetical protein EZS28_008896 [Streblomastix strix]|uniref:Uncharacterized protein n=1 Tax=Streblomastix strix TaxID=222440 RepID=A0A5J4WL28_9EUKA|nr:MAG: hypothetical protein EZS28_008896 [Streblomastix strix]